MTLTITNGLTGCAPDRNMTIGRTGNMVAGQNSCGYSTYTIPTTGLIVQNAPCACRTGGGSVLARYAYVPDGTRASSQDVTFSFSQPVQNLKITVADISSARPNGGWVPGYVGNYYDHVGFSITPTEISHAAARDKGTGAGTFAAPFRRNDTNAQSSSGPYSEVFSFGPTTSLRTLTMRYNNGPTSNNIKGTQAIFIPTITFDMPCNC
ncbi:MAG: hypothetical protein Q4F65_02385 [Propionibacteriaceae bacterium]|nr:hypothetical protein [Propionibacteriaceae bacterium]